MSLFDEEAFKSTDLLNESECLAIIQDLDELRHFWRRRHATLPFYTMGLASYLDITSYSNRLHYYNGVEANNRVLKENFDWLYFRLLGVLSDTLQYPAYYCVRQFALPGFHIFGAHKAFTVPRGSIHCDLQYTLLDWTPLGGDFTDPFSFTATIALPQGGGGLNLWNLRQKEMTGLSPQETQRIIASRQRTFHAYRVGEMVIHSGHQVHQIAPMIRPQPFDRRITLQGHGVLYKNTLYLYW